MAATYGKDVKLCNISQYAQAPLLQISFRPVQLLDIVTFTF